MCEVARDSAFEKVMEMCPPDDVEKMLRPMFGISEGEDVDVDAVLEAGVGPDSGFAEINRWVHAKTTVLMKDGVDFSEASAQAYEEADRLSTGIPDDASDLQPAADEADDELDDLLEDEDDDELDEILEGGDDDLDEILED